MLFVVVTEANPSLSTDPKKFREVERPELGPFVVHMG